MIRKCCKQWWCFLSWSEDDPSLKGGRSQQKRNNGFPKQLFCRIRRGRVPQCPQGCRNTFLHCLCQKCIQTLLWNNRLLFQHTQTFHQFLQKQLKWNFTILLTGLQTSSINPAFVLFCTKSIQKHSCILHRKNPWSTAQTPRLHYSLLFVKLFPQLFCGNLLQPIKSSAQPGARWTVLKATGGGSDLQWSYRSIQMVGT